MPGVINDPKLLRDGQRLIKAAVRLCDGLSFLGANDAQLEVAELAGLGVNALATKALPDLSL